MKTNQYVMVENEDNNISVTTFSKDKSGRIVAEYMFNEVVRQVMGHSFKKINFNWKIEQGEMIANVCDAENKWDLLLIES